MVMEEVSRARVLPHQGCVPWQTGSVDLMGGHYVQGHNLGGHLANPGSASQ